MLRMIDKKNGKAIWKSSTIDRKTGAEIVNFYGVRDADAKDTPFDSEHGRLAQAREALDAPATA